MVLQMYTPNKANNDRIRALLDDYLKQPTVTTLTKLIEAIEDVVAYCNEEGNLP